jgi:hypothetical protein
MAQYPRQFKRVYLPITIRPLWGNNNNNKYVMLIIIIIIWLIIT